MRDPRLMNTPNDTPAAEPTINTIPEGYAGIAFQEDCRGPRVLIACKDNRPIIGFDNEDKGITLYLDTGEIEHQGYTPDEAAQEFWKAVTAAFPSVKEQILSAHYEAAADRDEDAQAEANEKDAKADL